MTPPTSSLLYDPYTFTGRSKTLTKKREPSSSFPPELIKLASSLPWEIILLVLRQLASLPSHLLPSRSKVSLLLINREVNRLLTPAVYHKVILTSSHSLMAFSQLIAQKSPSQCSTPPILTTNTTTPTTLQNRSLEIARSVKRIWVGPDDSRSDLITALSPPTGGEATHITRMREKVQEDVRKILRSCRRLRDVSLSGQLLSLQVVETYGTACQPLKLTSVNPNSFVGGFSAPIFRKVRRLHIWDNNLAFEEVDQIRTLKELRKFIWTAPKDYGDSTRDLNVLRRLLERPRKHPVTLPNSSDNTNAQVTPGIETPLLTGGGGTTGSVSRAGGQTTTMMNDDDPRSLVRQQQQQLDQEELARALWNDLEELSLSERLTPVRPSKNDKFSLLEIRTSKLKCGELEQALRSLKGMNGFELVEEDPDRSWGQEKGSVEKGGEDPEAPISSSEIGNATVEEGGRRVEIGTVVATAPSWGGQRITPKIRLSPLQETHTLEWEALRDLLNETSSNNYSNLFGYEDPSGNDGYQDPVDGGKAFARALKEWEEEEG
ncbi:hypothetical protein IE53DRAFT_381093 [Violaceomyces palustris]|uniref:Uncharacterized protein n=1 Tax=Violaceomyces palustris TaxID=1673888 RepID=A0ACD0NSL7_9BASI|nr:hypothetical protein IE53DRAFT_381093 [Violaceomyces palustris]